jgi:hypothetical protein
VDAGCSTGIPKIGESRFITLGDDRRRVLVSREGVVATQPDRRVLVAVAPRLLGDLLARELDRIDLEVVVLDDSGTVRGDLRFDVVVTNGLPPPSVEAATVVRLPDRMRGDQIGSLLTAEGVERLRLTELARVVGVVDDLCFGDGTRSE